MFFSFLSAARFASSCVSLIFLMIVLAGSPAQAAPSISVNDVTITEGDSGAKNAVFTVSLSEPAAVDVGFWVGTAEVSAVGNDDFQHYYSSPYTIPAGQTTYTMNLVIFGDSVMETDETFQVLLENVTNATVVKGVGVGTIVNDDAGPSPTLMIGNQWIAEGNAGTKTANFTVQLSQVAATDVSFSVATSNGTASAGSDYTGLNVSNQVIPAGQLRKTVAVTISGDTSSERDENFTVNLSNVTGATLGRGQALGTIGNDDNVSAVKISVSDVYVQEHNSGTQEATFYVSLSQAAASTVTFDIKTEDSSASAGSDYVAKALVGQTIAAGQTSKTFTVTVNGDTTPEDEEHFIVTLANVSTNAALQYADPHGVASIPNDDAILSIGDASIVEGDSGTTSMAFPVTLSAPVDGQVQFHFLTCDGTATVAGGDYWATGDAFFTYFPGGATTMMVYVTVNGDFDLEDDETFCVNLKDVSGAQLGDSQAIGTILNDDVAEPTISLGDVSMLEGDSGFEGMYFPVTLSHPANKTIYIDVHTEACGAAQPDINVPYTPGDYTTTSYSNFPVYAGATTAQVYVSVRGDTDFEPDEQFCLKLDSANGANLGNVTGIGTVLNDDVVPEISINDASAIERSTGIDTQMYFSVTLSKPATTDVTFDVVTDYGTAAPDVDFVSTSVVGLKIPAGQAGVAFPVTLKGDDDIETDETFSVSLSNVVGVPVARAQGLGTIINDDSASLSIAPGSFVEGNDGTSAARFVVTLSHPMSVPVTFDVSTYSGGSAGTDTDYVARTQNERVIDPGRTRVVFEVTINGDTTDEPDEFFYVGLSNGRGAYIDDQLVMGTIQDDDAPGVTAIALIQGSGASSALLGEAVEAEGVVTALTGQGFFLQSAEGQQDGDPATSEGLFVSGASSAVAVGDQVRVGGSVQEVRVSEDPDHSAMTQIAANKVSVLRHGQALPQALVLQGETSATASQASTGLERFEGMRVAISPLTVLAPSGGSIDERSSRVRSDGRFYAAVRGIDRRPQRLRIASTGQRGASALSADRGDVVTGLIGVLSDGNGAFELLPDPSAAIRIASGARPTPVASALATEATLGSFNLRRFFDSSRQGSEPVLAPDAYATRLAKTANAICDFARSPAILGVQEIENAHALGDLAAAVNSRAGNILFPDACKRDPVYVALRDPSRADSRLGLLVSTAPVRPGVPRVEVRSVAALADAETFSRRDGSRETLFESPPLLVQARINGEGGEVLDLALIVAQFGDLDARTNSAAHGWAKRADYLRSRRDAQARALAGVIRTQQRLQPRQPLVLLADVEGLSATLGMTDLTSRTPRTAKYSVVRDGNDEAVDKVLVNQALMAPAFAARVEFARINADFGEDNYSDLGVPVRVSDHDPVVLFLRMH